MEYKFKEGWLKNKVAIVTGAGRGIGLVIAARLARDGAKVMLGDVSAEYLAKGAKQVAAAGNGEVLSHVGDLSQQAEAEAMTQNTLEQFGTLDILVNNAGGGVIRPFLSHTPETLKTTIDRNLWTAIWCSRAALPAMVKNGFGRIINVGADSVRNGLWDHAAYNAAKGGMHGLTTGLAREFAKAGITVNTVAPCAVSTPQLEELRIKAPALTERFLSVIPMGRAAEMEEVASMISYLASPEAAFVTGQVISVNGGSTML